MFRGGGAFFPDTVYMITGGTEQLSVRCGLRQSGENCVAVVHAHVIITETLRFF